MKPANDGKYACERGKGNRDHRIKVKVISLSLRFPFLLTANGTTETASNAVQVLDPLAEFDFFCHHTSFGELIRNVEWESDVHIFAPKETSASSRHPV